MADVPVADDSRSGSACDTLLWRASAVTTLLTSLVLLLLWGQRGSLALGPHPQRLEPLGGSKRALQNATAGAAAASHNCSLTEAAAVQFKFMADTAYHPSLPELKLQKGIVSLGDVSRTRRLMLKLLSGQAITAVYIGGSITWGQGASERGRTDHAALTLGWIKQTFPHANHTLLNRAIPATPSTYMSHCLNRHVPQEADLVVLEYNINDGSGVGDNPMRRAHERLIRKLLAYPNRPAVMEVVVFRWELKEVAGMHIPYRYHGDDEMGVLAQYYHLPWLALRSLMWDTVYGGGNLAQNQVQSLTKNQIRSLPWFMDDPDHPNDIGHRYLSDLVIGVMRRALTDLALHPYGDLDEEMVHAPLPPPMYRDNWPSQNTSCIMGHLFRARALNVSGFQWVNEGTPQKKKWGWVGSQPGAEMTFEINTALVPAPPYQPNATTPVGIVHLRSYEHMGLAELSCVSGCSCSPYMLDGHHEERESQSYFDLWEVSRAERCVIRARVLKETRSGEHKVKLIGVIVSETPGRHDMAEHAMVMHFI